MFWCLKVDVEGAVRSKPDKKFELLEVWRLHNGSTSHDVGSYYSTLHAHNMRRHCDKYSQKAELNRYKSYIAPIGMAVLCIRKPTLSGLSREAPVVWD